MGNFLENLKNLASNAGVSNPQKLTAPEILKAAAALTAIVVTTIITTSLTVNNLIVQDSAANHTITITANGDEAANRALRIPLLGADKFVSVTTQADGTLPIADGTITLAKLESRARVPGNLLINGGFDFFQRQAPGAPTSRTDTQFGPDRWRVITETAAVNVSRGSGDAGSRHSLALAQPQAVAQRMGVSQVIEGINSIPLRARTVRFQARVRCSSNQAIRCAILEGLSEDSLPPDVINSWTSPDYTDGAGKFFNNTNLDVATPVPGTVMPGTSTWASLSVTTTLTFSLSNLVVVIWTEGPVAQNGTLEITESGLYDGTEARDWFPRPFGEELALCQRYYEKITSTSTMYVPRSAGASTSVIPYAASKRITPIVAIDSFSSSSDISGQAARALNNNAFAIECTLGGSLTNNINSYTVTADAEL